MSSYFDRPVADVMADLQYGQTYEAGIPPLPVFAESEGWVPDPDSGGELLELCRIIPNPKQPREKIDDVELARLVENVTARGLLNPVRVVWCLDTGKWMLVLGERRWRAALAAGWTHIAARRARGDLSELEILLEQIADHTLGEAWNAIEEAIALREACRLGCWTQRDCAEHCHLSLGRVHRALRLLELEQRVQDLVRQGRLKRAAALELVGLPPSNQVHLAEQAAQAGMTAREMADEVREPLFQIGTDHPARRGGSKSKKTKTVIKIKLADGTFDKVVAYTNLDVDELLGKARKQWRKDWRNKNKDVPPAAAA